MLLPKFKLEKDYDLVGALRALGVTALFDKHSNTTGITGQRIVIDLVTPAPSGQGPRAPTPPADPGPAHRAPWGVPRGRGAHHRGDTVQPLTQHSPSLADGGAPSPEGCPYPVSPASPITPPLPGRTQASAPQPRV